MKSIQYAPHKVIGFGIVVAIAAIPLCASASVHHEVPTPLQLHPVVETQTDHQPAIGMVYDSALPPPSAILATGLSPEHASQKTPTSPFSDLHFDPSIAIASNSNRRQPRSSNWIVLIGILSFSGIILWRILATQSGSYRSSHHSFDSGSHDSSDSSSHSDYGNYSDSSDFGGGSSDGGGDGGDW